jgi:acyl carrier protein
LEEERREVVQALLELRCFPIGMELFPAADEAAWKYICDVIDDSDYYVLIIGGRYGSVDDAGISFTEREYDYAVSKKVPVLAFNLTSVRRGKPTERPSTSSLRNSAKLSKRATRLQGKCLFQDSVARLQPESRIILWDQFSQRIASACKPFTMAKSKIKYFEASELDAAMSWVGLSAREQSRSPILPPACRPRFRNFLRRIITILTQKEIYEKVSATLVEALNVDEDDIQPTATLQGDLGAESIDFLDIVFRLEREFGIQIPRGELSPGSSFQGNPEFVENGKVTAQGLAKLRARMPFADLSEFQKDPQTATPPRTMCHTKYPIWGCWDTLGIYIAATR